MLTSQYTIADTESESIVIGEKLSLYSDVLGEERQYWVHLPFQYNENKRYPVLYLLDGDAHFESTTGVLMHLSRNGRIPPMIMVAIPNTDRTRDLTPTRAVDEEGNTPEFFKTSGGGNCMLYLKTPIYFNLMYRLTPVFGGTISG
jgi:predicted alpha/beta superfamily hydrolase